MSRKFIFATVATVCLAMVFSPLMSAERARSDSDRGKASTVQQDDRSIPETFNDLTRARTETVRERTSTAATAAKLLSAAKQQSGDAAIATLNQVLALGLDSTTENDKILAETHVLLGDLYQGSASKQVAYYGIALQFTSEPAARQAVEAKIQDLGGDVFALTFNGTQAPTMGTRDLGVRDTCDAAQAVTLDYSSGFVLNIDNSVPGFPDKEWFSFDVPGPDGYLMRLETLSDTPGTTLDDTDLTLWGGCDAGNPVQQIAFNDDSPLANGPYMSRIDTGCLLPGTYYVEVGGWIDVSSPDNFELQIAVSGTCELPAVDSYEADDNSDDAASIGHPTSIPTHANGWGRARKDVQDRTIFPVGDVDNARVKITRNELVNMETSVQFPTFFNGFSEQASSLDEDTVMDLRYGKIPNYGGFCNDPGNGFPNDCFVDADCDGLVINPLPGFPDCIPLFLFSGFGGFNNPSLAFDDDGGPGFGSSLTICLPPSIQTSGDGTVADDWVVEVNPFSSSDIFEYQLRVQNLTRCDFESEPNNDFPEANPLTLGDTVHGIFDFSVTFPFQDADLFAFDVDEDSLVTFETLGYDSFAVDTAFQTFVGPDDNGLYFTLGSAGTNDDGGAGFLSLISYILPPANDLLGNTTADADYYLNVTSFYLNPNYPYTLVSEIAAAPLVESEPNNDCSTNANSVSVGDEILASVNPAGDRDAFKFTVTGNTFVDLATGGTGDTVLALVDCSTNAVLACDDDGGPGLLSAITGCLGAGDYCVQVRAFSAGSTFNYSLSVGGGGSCPTPGSVSGTGGLGCPF